MRAIVQQYAIKSFAITAFGLAASGFVIPSSLSTKAAIASIGALVGSIIGTVKADETIIQATRAALPVTYDYDA
jgi:cytosine/uracil/thiamine/allantoin permease